MKQFKLLALATSMTLALAACGGSGDVDVLTSKDIKISGVAVDDPIANAKACLDVNVDKQCNSNEPNDTTDENGNYDITVPQGTALDGKSVLVIATADSFYAGKPDTAGSLTNLTMTSLPLTEAAAQNGTLSDVVANPFTTIAAAKAQKDGTTPAAALQAIAEKLGVTPEELSADYTKATSGNADKIQKVAAALGAGLKKIVEEVEEKQDKQNASEAAAADAKEDAFADLLDKAIAEAGGSDITEEDATKGAEKAVEDVKLTTGAASA